MARRVLVAPSAAAKAAARRPATPKVVGQGIAVYVGYLALSRVLVPFRWFGRRFSQVFFNWKDYRKYYSELTVFDVMASSSKVTMGFGATVIGWRAFQRARKGTERIVLHEVLQPGDELIIHQIPRKAKKRR